MAVVPNGLRAIVVAFVTLAVATGVALGATGAKPRARFEQVAHLPLAGAITGDVFAHRGFAYLSSWGGRACPSAGVRTVDIRNPRRPAHVGTFADAATQPKLEGTWTEKTIVRSVSTAAFRGVLAVTSVQACRKDAFEGFALYDVTDPAQPRELALVETQPRGSHEIWLQLRNGKPYVWTAIPGSERTSSPDGQRPGRADFRIYDVSDPRAPRQVSEWGAWRVLGIRPDRVPERFLDWSFVHSVIGNAAGTRAYLSYWDLGTVILDVSNPARPRYLGRTAPGRGNVHSAWLARGGRVLVETHEVAGGRPTLWDISNARRPRKLADFGLPASVVAHGRGDRISPISGLDLADSVHDPKVAGNVAYFSWYRQGVVAVDIATPRKPRFLARFLPTPSRDDSASLCGDASCISVWGVYPVGGYVLASDMGGGLWIVRLRR